MGGKVSKVSLSNMIDICAFSANQYIQDAIHNVKMVLAKQGMTLRKGTKSVISNHYHPEYDISDEYDATYSR